MNPGPNSDYSQWGYIVDPNYADYPEHYTRAYLMIQEDLKHLFEYVEPCDQNLCTHSYRIYNLFVRTCIEVEANFKAILHENIYNGLDDKWSMTDYRLVNTTHHLDDYQVRIPIWTGFQHTIKPFEEWKIKDARLSWYQAYNECKHNRQQNFQKATFENLLKAISGLLVLLSSQFQNESFAPGTTTLSVSGDGYYEGEFGLGDFFIIKYPNNWNDDELYDFNWPELKKQANRFQKIDYNIIKAQITQKKNDKTQAQNDSVEKSFKSNEWLAILRNNKKTTP